MQGQVGRADWQPQHQVGDKELVVLNPVARPEACLLRGKPAMSEGSSVQSLEVAECQKLSHGV